MSDELAAVQDRTFAGATSATVASYPPERRLSGPERAGQGVQAARQGKRVR
jgi:hypothetical protein